MTSLRKRLTYANVMSSIAIVLALGGASALAANQLAKSSVGKKQLKANAVTTAKIKKNAVTKAKIKKGAIDSSKVADGSLTGADINAASTSFSQIVARLRVSGPLSTAPAPVLLGSFTQNAGEDAQFLAGYDVTFPSSCAPPRDATALLLIDPANPAVPTIQDLLAYSDVEDNGTGDVTKRVEFSGFPGSMNPMSKTAPAAATGHTFYVYFAGSSCATASATNVGLDVIGTK